MEIASDTFELIRILFSPCTRLYDLLESQDGRVRDQNHFQERNLNVSTEELLGGERAFTFADLYAMMRVRNQDRKVRDNVAWLTPHAGMVRENGIAMRYWNQLHESYRFFFSADGKAIVAFARSSDHLLEIVDVVLRLLALSVVHSLLIESLSLSGDTSISAPPLAYLMEQCQSLKFFIIEDFVIIG
jgi:hypothetical protein